MHPGSHDLDPQSALGPDAQGTHSPGGAECFPHASCLALPKTASVLGRVTDLHFADKTQVAE